MDRYVSNMQMFVVLVLNFITALILIGRDLCKRSTKEAAFKFIVILFAVSFLVRLSWAVRTLNAPRFVPLVNLVSTPLITWIYVKDFMN